MKPSFRNPKKERNAHLSDRRHKRDADGRIIIDMTVKNDDDFLSVYSMSETPVISTDVAEFIENSTHSISVREQFALHIHSNCIDEGEKAEYAAAIKEYYAEKHIANKKELNRNKTTIAILTLAGIIVLALAFQIENAVWSEVIDIAAWVLLWEAVDIGAFKNREAGLKQKRYLAFTSMKIVYHPIEAHDCKEQEKQF